MAATTMRLAQKLNQLKPSSTLVSSPLSSTFLPKSRFYFLCSSTSSPSSSPSPPLPPGGLSLAAAAAADVVPDISPSTATPLPNPGLLQPRVVVYDGVCHLCHRGVKWVIKADKYRKIKFCCLQSEAAEPYLRVAGLDREDVLRRFLFIEGLGSYHQGSSAALRVLSYLPLPYSALSALSIVPTPLRDAVYDQVAKRRYAWCGKADECLVMKEQDMLERFVDRDEILDKSRSVL
ncbi:hypothetical protein Tsubulata_019384 [Turnera subulata]|uniref:Thiol-disulfide oxidoreductase DCC n=1 Tax=Turnera subulata TaxID=218843 RepID=A0A9Q0JFD5_9ROSI|nr:hypothetical protein Tsubulata_019384 [Turnera subulata]